MEVVTYLSLDGRTEEALAFYQRALGAEVAAIHRFKDSPDPSMIPPRAENKIMHVTFSIGDTTIMASDGSCQGEASFQGFSLSLNVVTESEAERYFAALADGGQVRMPLAKTFFAPRFGLVTDR